MENEQEKRQFQKRSPALKVTIREILEGTFVREEAPNPTYILTGTGEKVSRANIVSNVLMKDIAQNDTKVIIDDGTGQISLRSFDNKGVFEEVNVGDAVIVIGKPREFNSEKYISVEILRKLDSLLWMNVRKLELQKKYWEINSKNNTNNAENIVDNVADELPSNKNILDLIRRLDKGQGVEFSELAKHCGEKAKEDIDRLIRKGDIFELRSGVFKVLE